MADGSEHVGLAAPKINLAIAITIAAISKIGAGQELGLAKGAGPTAFHRFPRHPAFAHHLHGGIQFTGEQIAATAIKGERRQRGRQIIAAKHTAIAGFDAPDRRNHGRRHAAGGFGLGEQIPIGGKLALAVRDAVAAEFAGQIVGKADRFGAAAGLVAIGADHARHQLHVAQRRVQPFRFQPAGRGLGAIQVQPIGKRRLLLR